MHQIKLIKLLFQGNRPLAWIFWHPHQGLWNWSLVGIIRKIIPLNSIFKLVSKTIILIDTIILYIYALGRRLSKLGIKSLFYTTKIPNHISILYFDIGTHKEAQELTLMINKILPSISKNHEAYGFEAGLEFFEQAQAKFVGRKNISIIHRALCHVLPSSGRVKLYKAPEDGEGSSIYRPYYTEYEEVEAIKFSDWVRENKFNFENNICLLRMNIEGAEYDVIKDIVESGLAKYIDGYYGMWDDVSKIDKQRDEEFRGYLAKNHIFPFTFNGRDFTFPFRIKCIEYDINTYIQAGLRRIKKEFSK